ncbi:zinc finger protein 594-like [Gambusia affinis]|uniref:zinc finger protein 594-like n=1 Tax=Gambusia affinis TaxID=33528 RepID=UPI001CDC7FC2|nr:zinc finger protein 594-like [Gambusia affinis]
MDDHRRLLDFSRTPRIILHRIDSLKCNVQNQERRSTLDQEELEPLQVKQEKEVPEDHQIKVEEKEVYCSQDSLKCNVQNQERRSTLDQEELEPLQVTQEKEKPEDHQIKVEEKEVYCSQGEERIELNQETDTCMMVPVDEQTNHNESEPNRNQDVFQESAESEKQNQERRKPFSCVTCEKRFTFKSVFDAHMRTHTGEKPFSCVNCGKSFSRKQELTLHMMIHTGEKPFSCVNCGKSFNHKPNLTKHMNSLKCNVYNQERRSTLDQEELEPLQVKQEQEEPEDHQIKMEDKEVYCSVAQHNSVNKPVLIGSQ